MDNSFSRWKSKVENKIRLYRVQVLHLSFVSRLDPTPSNKPCLRPTCMSPASFDTYWTGSSVGSNWKLVQIKIELMISIDIQHLVSKRQCYIFLSSHTGSVENLCKNSGTYLRTEVGILSIQLHRIHHILPTYHLLIKRGLKEHLKRNCLLQAGVQQKLIFYKFKVFTFNFRCTGQQ